MNRAQAINDLKTLQEYFMQESGGSYPLCIEYAINALTEKENEQQGKGSTGRKGPGGKDTGVRV